MKKIAYVVRFNKQTNKYELFQCCKRRFAEYKFRDISVDGEEVVIDYNIKTVGSRGYVEKLKYTFQREMYGTSQGMLYFLNNHIEALGLDKEPTYEELYALVKSATKQDFLTYVERANALEQSKRKPRTSDEREL